MKSKQRCIHHQTTDATSTCVSLVPIFNHLATDQLNEVMQVVRSFSYKKGEILYHAGDESNALYIVNRGQIKVYRLSETGKEQLIRILNSGDFTGELALFQETVHEAYAEALVDTEICLIHRHDLQQLLIKYPSISLKILTEFASRLQLAEKQSTLFATEKVETRLALFLAELLDAKSKTDSVIELPMSKKDLASYLGTTPETISRRLKEFETEGFIKQKGQRQIEILNVDGLLFI